MAAMRRFEKNNRQRRNGWRWKTYDVLDARNLRMRTLDSFSSEVEEDRGKGQAVRAVASQSTAVAGTVSRGRWRDRELLGGVGLKRQLPSWRGQYPPPRARVPLSYYSQACFPVSHNSPFHKVFNNVTDDTEPCLFFVHVTY